MSDLPTGTVTLLFTDIEGSTRLLQELGRERYVEALTIHRELLRTAFTRQGGVEVEMQGDSFHFSFSTAREAVLAAAAGQRALVDYDWPSASIRVRVGLHTGEPVVVDDLYAGLDVHRAARVMSAAHGGQVLVSARTADLVANEWPKELSVRDLGEHRLKDLLEPQRLYQLVGSGLELEFPPPRTLENRPTNLPVQPTPLVGREHELRELLKLVGDERVRLVTFTGPGGSGKTRLALQVAAELIERYPSGVFLVHLAALTDPELVLPTIAQTLGVKEQSGESIGETLARDLAEKELLLVLDNFEQVLDAARAVGELLAHAPSLNLLVTSRSSLHLQAEHEYSVPPLVRDEAVALFAERARAAKASFSLNGNRPVVAEICRRLDQLPLAIELAAARIKLLPETALLARLDDKLKLLTGGARDLDERQRTLRAAIDWSYELLAEEEQTLFRRLAVFAGGRSLDAIEAVCTLESNLDMFECVASLLDKSLLRQEEGEDGEPRLVMLETIHEYAREKLEQSGEADELRRGHAEYFLTFARERRVGEGDRSVLPALEAERGNFRVALDWFRAAGTAEQELDLAATLSQLWFVAGPASEGQAVLAAALARAPDAPDELRVRALNSMSGLAYFCGRYDEAVEASEEALELARRIDDKTLIMKTVGNVGLDRLAHDDAGSALPLLEEAVALAEELDDPLERIRSRVNLGYARLVAGDIEGAYEVLPDAAECSQNSGDPYARAVSVFNLGLVLLRQDKYAAADASFQESFRAAEEGGIRYGMAMAMLGLAAVAVRNGDAPRAATLLGCSDAVRDEIEVSLEPYEQRLRDEIAATIEGRLSAEVAQAALAYGAKLTPEAVVG